MNLLDVCVAAGESGPVVMVSGEADLTTVAQLDGALNAQISAGAQILTVDLSGLRFADSASIAALVRASRRLRDQGGRLELMNPQPTVTRTLSLLGLDQALTVRAAPGRPNAGLAPAHDDHQA